MLEQASQLRDQYNVKLQEEIEKLKSPVLSVPSSVPIRPPSTSSSMLSSEAAEFIPSSNLQTNLQTNYYDYYQHQQEGYFPTCYPSYEPDYCYNDQFNVAYSHHLEPPQTGIEANILSNMLNILKTS